VAERFQGKFASEDARTMDGFAELVERLRANDEDAAVELLEKYGPHVRRVARRALEMAGLGNHADSSDVCQSVIFAFLRTLTLGKLAVATPKELLALLAEIARNKVRDLAANTHAARRDCRRIAPVPIEEIPLASREPFPDDKAADEELLRAARGMLTSRDWRLCEEHYRGRGWSALAIEFAASPAALRMRVKSILKRLRGALG